MTRDQLRDSELRNVLCSSGYESDSNTNSGWSSSFLSSKNRRNRGMMKGKSIANLYHAVNNESLEATSSASSSSPSSHLLSPSSTLSSSSSSSNSPSMNHHHRNLDHSSSPVGGKLKPAKSCFFRADECDDDEILETILKTTRTSSQPHSGMRRKRLMIKSKSKLSEYSLIDEIIIIIY